MKITKEYSYARPARVTRICPVCKYTDSTIFSDSKFIRLETMQCHNNPSGESTTILFACPKCGTVGIDVEVSD